MLSWRHTHNLATVPSIYTEMNKWSSIPGGKYHGTVTKDILRDSALDFNFFIISLSFYMCGCFGSMCICAPSVCSSRRAGEGRRNPGTGVIEGCEFACGCWAQNPGPQQEQPLLSSPQPLNSREHLECKSLSNRNRNKCFWKRLISGRWLSSYYASMRMSV